MTISESDDSATLDLTVAVPTRNRSADVAGLLESVAATRKPLGWRFEILIGLNACKDDSAAVVAKFAAILPVVAVEEPRPGVSHARNAIVRRARGQVIAWLDDDSRVAVDWMEEYAKAIQAHPDADFLGGAIEPVFQDGCPRWLAQIWGKFGDVFALRRPEAATPVTPDALPYGANYGVKLEIQKKHPFDPRFGRQESYLVVGGGDSSNVRQLMNAGARGRWAPAIRVQHIMRAERTTRKYIFKYYAGYGYWIECASWDDAGSPPRGPVGPMARAMFDMLLTFFGNADQRGDRFKRAATLAGVAFARLHFLRSGRRQSADAP